MEKNEASEHVTDLSLVGLEEVFVQVEHSAKNEQIAGNSNIHEHVHELDAESFELVSMAEAARRLKMPYPTLRRQVISGKIPSITGTDGKPLVKIAFSEYSNEQREQQLNKPEQKPLESEYSATIHRLLEQMEAERVYSRSLNERLEAANHRNGYLEAQVDQQKEQIKLLTDTQKPNRSWLQKFGDWLIGAKA